MRKFVLELEIEDVDEDGMPVEPTDSETLLSEFIAEGHVRTHHYFYDDDNKRRAIARLTYVCIKEDD